MKIILARHGQTTGDIENRYGGDYDDDMTELGQQQAAELASRLAVYSPSLIYTSPLKRAQQTASIVAELVGVEYQTLSGFKERNSYGILTGLTKSEAAIHHPTEVELLKDVHNAVTGAEDYEAFKERVTKALLMVLGHSSKGSAVVVTHGGPISTVVREILKLGETKISDCGFLVLMGSIP